MFEPERLRTCANVRISLKRKNSTYFHEVRRGHAAEMHFTFLLVSMTQIQWLFEFLSRDIYFHSADCSEDMQAGVHSVVRITTGTYAVPKRVLHTV